MKCIYIFGIVFIIIEMHMDKVLILSTPLEIAQGLSIILEKYHNDQPDDDFKNQKLSAIEAANYLGISYQTFNRWVRENRIVAYGSGKTRFFIKSELVEAYKNMKP